MKQLDGKRKTVKKCKDGKCSICGKYGGLTFEHIPPKATFNNVPIKTYSAIDVIGNDKEDPWDLKNVRYINNQKGYGKCCLCLACNNNFGSWYVPAYQKFIYTILAIISRQDITNLESIKIGMRAIPTLQIIKQVMSMYCSVINDNSDSQLRDFLLDREKTGIDIDRYKICIFYNKGPMSRVNPISALGTTSDGLYVFSELCFVPVGFLIYLNPKKDQSYKGTDITYFAESGYDIERDIELDIMIYECNSILPMDYRSRSEIVNQRQKNELNT